MLAGLAELAEAVGDPIECCGLVLDVGTKLDCGNRERGMKAGEADCIFFRSEQSGRASGSSLNREAVEIARCVGVMVWEDTVTRKMHAGAGDACEELLGARNSAEGQYRALDLRDFHGSMQAPDRAAPAPRTQFGFEFFLVGGDCDDVGPPGRRLIFAEVSRGEQAVMPIRAVQDQDVDIAMKLAVLKAVVQKMRHLRWGWRLRVQRRWRRFSEDAGIVALRGHVDRYAGLARDQERLVAKFVGCAAGVDARGERTLPFVAAREDIDGEPKGAERLGERDGQRRLARAAGGEIADADHGKAQAADGLAAGGEASFSQGEAEAVERGERR